MIKNICNGHLQWQQTYRIIFGNYKSGWGCHLYNASRTRRKLCESNKDSVHDKVKALARELLNDWEAIFRIPDYPHYPLTNNEAERALRRWVLLRKVTQGSQSESGCRATCAIASVIGTAKKRAKEFVDTLKTHLHDGLGVMNHIMYRPLRLSG